MLLRIAIGLLLAFLAQSVAFAQQSYGVVVTSCGAQTLTAGNRTPFFVKTDGSLCTDATLVGSATNQGNPNAGGALAWWMQAGVGAFVDGAITTIGTEADVLWTSGSGTLIALQKAIATDLGAPGSTVCATDTGSCSINSLAQRLAQRLTSIITTLGSPMQQTGGTVGIVAGTAIIGKVGIDQTTPGTTNAVSASGTISNASSAVATSSVNVPTIAYNFGYNGTTWDQLQVDGSKNLKVSVQNATITTVGNVSNASSAVATSSTNIGTISYNYGFNGTTWDQLQVDGSKNLKVTALGATSNASSAVATSSTNVPAIAYLFGFNGTTWDQLQVDGSKFLKVSIQNATLTAVGNISNASSGVATSSTNLGTIGYLYGFNGTTWDQLQVDASKNLKVLPALSAALAPGVAGSASSSLVLKASAGSLIDVYATCTSACWLMVFNATSLPGNGATTAGIASGNLQDCVAINANGVASIRANPPETFANGITAAISSTSCGTLTASTVGFIHGRAQ